MWKRDLNIAIFQHGGDKSSAELLMKETEPHNRASAVLFNLTVLCGDWVHKPHLTRL